MSTRLNRPGFALPVVTSLWVRAKPAATSRSLIRPASFMLNSNSVAPRALVAPGTSAVWPTSSRTRNWPRLQRSAGAAAAGAATAGGVRQQQRADDDDVTTSCDHGTGPLGGPDDGTGIGRLLGKTYGWRQSVNER